MTHPLVYEINTRCWLREFAASHDRPLTLGSIPDTEIERWQNLGFTHVWLMGVWPTGPRSRAAAWADSTMRQTLTDTLPGWNDADFSGSPFAIADYTIAPELGGEPGLEKFRQKLHTHGMRLLLDFVPNHLGLDHRWVIERPDLFVQSPNQAPETFFTETKSGGRWVAHGKDPNFHAWIDTAQLDYRRGDTRTAVLESLHAVAMRCDGVRCDMAMLLLNEVFARTWVDFPCPAAAIESEFWGEAIPSIKAAQPDFLFLGEVYWDLEARLQSLGFDYTYDKRLYDYLVYRNPAEVARHLSGVTPEFVSRRAHFLENHDEPRVASVLSLPEHRPALLLTVGLPGLRLLHDGQLTGARIRTPVQLNRRPMEAPASEVEACYQQLLMALKTSAVGKGTGELLQPRPAWPDNPTSQNFVAIQWQSNSEYFDVVVVNLALHRGQCFVSLAVDGLARRNWRMQDLLGDEEYQRYGDDLQNHGLYLDLPANGAQLFHFSPI